MICGFYLPDYLLPIEIGETQPTLNNFKSMPISIYSEDFGVNARFTYLSRPQVLPARSHPEIMMNSTGGYLLTGVCVDTSAENSAKKMKFNQECADRISK